MGEAALQLSILWNNILYHYNILTLLQSVFFFFLAGLRPLNPYVGMYCILLYCVVGVLSFNEYNMSIITYSPSPEYCLVTYTKNTSHQGS